MNIKKWNSEVDRLGLFGGTFNPIHNAHIEVAKKSIAQFGLDKVVFVPAKVPPHKMDKPMPDANLRYVMVKLAVEKYPQFEVSKIELDREGPSYTIDTVEAILEQYTGKLFFIIGSDALAGIDTWKSPQRLLKSCSFIVAPRKNIGPEYFQNEYFEGADLNFLEMDEIHLSSSKIRKMVRNKISLDSLVPDETKQFIIEEKLYV